MLITLKFTPPLEDRLASFRQMARTGIYESIGRLAQQCDDILLNELRSEAPVRTGHFRDSIHSVQHGSQGRIVLEYRAMDPLDRFIIEGTKPHEIVPVSGKALAFVGANGETVFAKRVSHPGTAPNDFPARAWESARGGVFDVLARTGREIVEELAR